MVAKFANASVSHSVDSAYSERTVDRIPLKYDVLIVQISKDIAKPPGIFYIIKRAQKEVWLIKRSIE